MSCGTLTDVQFDQRSQEGVDSINRRVEAGSELALALSAGVLEDIFFGENDIIGVAYNIYQTSWDSYFNAMASISDIVKESVRTEASQLVLYYQPKNEPKLLQFWQCIYDGSK